MKIIGITGPSGAGKTTALRVLESMGAVVLDCDAIYHDLLASDPGLVAQIEMAFPRSVKNGILDRAALGARVFSDPAALERLNDITHPAVKREVLCRLAQTDASAAAIDAIALFESGLDALCDVTVAIIAPQAARVRRLMARDGISRKAALARIRAQKPAKVFRSRCKMTLVNRGTEEQFQKRCKQAFDSIMNIE